MYKVILLLKGRSGMASGDLTDLWLEQPWAEVAGRGNVARHLHNRAIPGAMPIENAPAATFDAIDEFWFADLAAARAWFGSRPFADFWRARCADLLSGPPLALSGTPHLLWDREVSQPSDPVKIITLPVRRDGMTLDAFAHHWIHIHSALALDGPGTRERLQRLEPCPSDNSGVSGFPAAPFDGAGTIEFAERRDLQIEFASDHYRDVMAPDEPRFTDASRSCALMVEPFLVS